MFLLVSGSLSVCVLSERGGAFSMSFSLSLTRLAYCYVSYGPFQGHDPLPSTLTKEWSPFQ